MDLTNIDYLGIDRVLKRGSGELLANRDDAFLVRDSVSGAYFLVCDDEKIGIDLLDRYIGRGCDLLMVSNIRLGRKAFERYGFSEKLECYQVAYFGEKPLPNSDLTVRTADERDLAMLQKSYQIISPEELEQVVRRRSIMLGYFQGQLVGFIGEHLEGSMGLLYVFPEFRRRGFAVDLQKHFIARTMENGFIPFGQVEKNNQASLNLQKKIGMTISENLIAWMWK